MVFVLYVFHLRSNKSSFPIILSIEKFVNTSTVNFLFVFYSKKYELDLYGTFPDTSVCTNCSDRTTPSDGLAPDIFLILLVSNPNLKNFEGRSFIKGGCLHLLSMTGVISLQLGYSLFRLTCFDPCFFPTGR